MFLRLAVANFAVFLSLFSRPAMASTSYRLSHVQTDFSEVKRPKQPFPNVEKVYRVVNLTTGAPFSSFNSEFVIKDGQIIRVKSGRVNHVMEMMLAQISENLICEKNLSAGVRKEQLMPGEAWHARTVGPIDRQALQEMNARKYIDNAEVDAYAGSTNMGDADRMIYLESLSWLSASEVLAVFEGKIPWTRISEVDAPEGLGSLELRKLAEAGDSRIRLRIRRATFRVVAAHALDVNHQREYGISLSDLPYASEYKSQGIALPKEAEDEIIYQFELGRASQIPGLEGEAEQLSALAGLIMWHHSMTFEDIRTGNKSDIRQVDALINMHALKRTHRMLYADHFGAVEHAKGVKPHDVVLRMSLLKFMLKTLPTLHLDGPATLRQIAVKADAMDLMRWDLDWIRGDQLMTKHHPITFRLSRSASAEAIKSFMRDVDDPQLQAKWFNAIMAGHDQISDYKFPESQATDHYNHQKHSKIPTEYFVSGFNMWAAVNPDYVPALMAAIVKHFEGTKGNARFVFIVPQAIESGHVLKQHLKDNGFEFVNMDPNDLDLWNGPWAMRITLDKLKELAKSNPRIAHELKHNPKLQPGAWRAEREISLLPGL